MGRRIYIDRSGATSNCALTGAALTGAKGDPRLPPPAAPDRWHFWMQIGPLQPEHREYGFNVPAAVKEITTNGYHFLQGPRDFSASARSRNRSQPRRKGSETSRSAYLFQCAGGDMYAVSHDIAGANNIPRSPCTLGWRLCEAFELGRRLTVPAPVMPEPILRGIADVGYDIWRGWSEGPSKRPVR